MRRERVVFHPTLTHETTRGCRAVGTSPRLRNCTGVHTMMERAHACRVRVKLGFG